MTRYKGLLLALALSAITTAAIAQNDDQNNGPNEQSSHAIPTRAHRALRQ